MMRSNVFSLRILSYLALSTCLLLFSFALPLGTRASVHCVSTDWHSMITFFILNYLSHAATVPGQPGARWTENLPWTIISLMLPFAGLGKTLGLLISYTSVFGQNVEKAVSRGAIAIVSRSKDWEPALEQSHMTAVRLPESLVQRLGLENRYRCSYTNARTYSNNNRDTRVTFNIITPPSMRVSDRCYDFCGKSSLPRGYHWVFPDRDHMANYALSYAGQCIPRSHSYLKMITSIVQLFSSSITLYRTRGSQLDQYGYAAFGLSVFPYLLMSLVNLCCAIILGEYPYLYPLWTPILEEARQHAEFDVSNEVGRPDNAMDAVEEHGDTFVLASLQVLYVGDIKRLVVDISGEQSTFTLCHHQDQADHVIDVSSTSIRPVFIPMISGIRDTRLYREPVQLGRIAVKRGSIIRLVDFAAMIVIFYLPLLFIFFLTRFHKRDSSFEERVWMMLWLCASQVAFYPTLLLSKYVPHFSWSSFLYLFNTNRDFFLTFIPYILPLPFLFVPAFGGFVVVAKMLLEFGTCSLYP